MDKVTVPNICESSGVSRDFRLAFGNLSNYLERVRDNDAPRTRHLAKRAFLHRPIPLYEEYFAPEKYVDVVSDKNRGSIEKIDNLIGEINSIRKAGAADYDRLHMLERKILALIAGNPEPSGP